MEFYAPLYTFLDSRRKGTVSQRLCDVGKGTFNMDTEEKITLSIPSVLDYEEVVVETIGTVARVKNFPFEKVSELKTAVAEACVNAIEHGNKAWVPGV